jgi:hypothetical protein
MSRNRRFVPPLLAALALAVLALGVVACGYTNDETKVQEGETVNLGDLEFNAIFSRYLNANDTEDSAYLVGQEPAPKGSSYFGVFLLVHNETSESLPLPSTVHITDADHQEYELLPSESLYAFPFGEELEEHEQIPILDSTAQQGPIEGALALFLLPESADENRPLILTIPGAEGNEVEVTLDL